MRIVGFLALAVAECQKSTQIVAIASVDVKFFGSRSNGVLIENGVLTGRLGLLIDLRLAAQIEAI